MDTLVHRISGSWAGFILGGLGYILLMVRYPKITIALPMVVLGLFALRGGLRFTVFAVPFFALGNGYIAYIISKYISTFIMNEKIEKYSIYIISLLLMAGFIYPNYKHIHQYIMPTVFNNNEVKVLDELKTKSKRDDYVLTWWDYGYPIRYYADVKTLVDGAKHSGKVNFPVSFGLTRDLVSSRNMAILDTYWTEYNYNHNLNEDYFKEMMKQYNFKDPNKFIDYLATDIKLPKLKEDIYYFLPLRMFNILPTVAIFSSIDLQTGKKHQNFFMQSNNFQQKGGVLFLENGARIDLSKKVIIFGRQIIPIKNFAMVAYNNNGKLIKNIQKVSNQGLNIIFMKSYKKFLIMDDRFFNSAYIQLFVFENGGGLFEPVILNPFVKVYKVKK
jgi:dolichyl-diphosphooligosaccharide--protein glycosyltransferase/undecaprenyl-diphosphooligosaccharide--protein glycosyltransferase